MAKEIKAGQFWINNKGGVYKVYSVKRGEIVVNHTWKNSAWTYTTVRAFREDFRQCISGKRLQRTKILADVIQQLDARKFKARAGEYLTFNKFESEWGLYEDHSKLACELGAKKNSQLQEFVQKPNIQCNVCAIGSLFIGSVDVYDKLKASKISGDNDIAMVHHLKKWFPEEELRLMEYVFENAWAGEADRTIDAYNFIRKVLKKVNSDKGKDKDEVMLRAIVANTLRHGKFSPEKGLA